MMTRRAAIALLFLFAVEANAKEYRLAPETDAEKVADRLAAGDVIVLKDGIWKDAELKFERLAGVSS